MGVDRQALPRLEQLHEQGRIRTEPLGVPRPEERFGECSECIRSRPAVRQRAEAGSLIPNTDVADPTQSSGAWSPALRIPRNPAIAGPPR